LGVFIEQPFISKIAIRYFVTEVVVLLGAVSVLTVAVMDAIRLTLGQIFSLMDGF